MSSIMIIRRYKCWPVVIEGKKQRYQEEASIQICGTTTDREMHVIADNLTPLRKFPYKLCCNCQHCIAYSYEGLTAKVVTEPFMKSINIVFSILCQCSYKLQSTTGLQNSDGSSTTTWVWIR
ncbi:unnamed protein product [Orchesella dallaii]|uniref:Uncharacterized protein n=1 Tax=Orchesella dallaii TaxID=48710 RepID=A0ABP1QDS7_9HEXA